MNLVQWLSKLTDEQLRTYFNGDKNKAYSFATDLKRYGLQAFERTLSIKEQNIMLMDYVFIITPPYYFEKSVRLKKSPEKAFM